MNDDPRYPIGRLELPPASGASAASRGEWIEAIAETPARLREAVSGLDGEQLATPYRDGGWSVLQVVHHVADSHVNAYIRFRLALTEDEPTIKPYDEAAWAELVDARTAEPELSLALLAAVHARWVLFLRSLGPGDMERRFRHPEIGPVTIEQNLALYAWHGRHHVAHVTSLRDRMGWGA